MSILRVSLLVINLIFALILLNVDNGMALVNLACALVLAIDITIRTFTEEEK